MADKSVLENTIKSRKEVLWQKFNDYSQESTVHSMNYLGKRFLHWIERTFWIIAFLCSAIFCISLIRATYLKWQNDPVLIKFNEKSTPTWQIPFPAITICPEMSINIEKINLTEYIHKRTFNESEKDEMYVLNQMCDYFDRYDMMTEERNIDFNVILRRIISKFKSNSQVSLGRITKEFKRFFSKIVTEKGICYTFNLLHCNHLYRDAEMCKNMYYSDISRQQEWDFDGYKNNHYNAYPYRVMGVGPQNGLQLLLSTPKTDFSYLCNGPSGGFRLALHSPANFPRIESDFIRIPFNREVIITVTPRVITTSDEIKDAYTPEQRQCFFPEEKQLKFFKFYTKSNCELECLSNFMIKKCGCGYFAYPRDKNTTTCTSKNQIICLSNAGYDYYEKNLRRSLKDIDVEKKHKIKLSEEIMDENDEVEEENYHEDLSEKRNNEAHTYIDENSLIDQCDCKPACKSLRYDTETSQAQIKYKQFYQEAVDKEEEPTDHKTFVKIFFKDDDFVESKRIELWNWQDYLANVGGFLGLLMGGSLLSIVEIIYHCTLKIIFRRRNKRLEDEEK